MIAARTPRAMIGFRYEEVIKAIDWNRVLLQARGLHSKEHADNMDTCGHCIQSVLLRKDEDG